MLRFQLSHLRLSIEVLISRALVVYGRVKNVSIFYDYIIQRLSLYYYAYLLMLYVYDALDIKKL